MERCAKFTYCPAEFPSHTSCFTSQSISNQIKFQNSKMNLNVPGELSQNSARTQRFSRRKKYHNIRTNFSGELSQNFVRTDTIF